MKRRDSIAAPSDPALDVELDAFVAAFESASARDPNADLAAFLPLPDHPRHADVLCELVRVDLEFAWDRGEERRLEYYQARFPVLFRDPVRLRAIVREEMRLRQVGGDEPGLEEYVHRFGFEAAPASSFSLPLTRIAAPGEIASSPEFAVAETPLTPITSTPNRMPRPGEVVAGFQLVKQLGKGAFGEVFLAHQADLADRLVVLKVSSRFPGESRVLARLQHANVVPVYSVHRHGPFHVVCMPYLGATTLADVLQEYRAAGISPVSGREVASTLSARAARTAGCGGESDDGGEPGTPCTALPPTTAALYERTSYVELVLWIGAELADGLAHAHERGVVHRDLKPANVLLTDDGRPMLLDFNLAFEAGTNNTFQGGTPRYMAPEHLTSLLERTGEPDARSDIYSLGLVLYELLAGRLPFPGCNGDTPEALRRLRDARRTAPTDIRQYRRDVTPAVVSILRKALDPDPSQRYPSAIALREDLRCQLEHRPLQYAPNRSPWERMHKWTRRHPRLSSWVTVSSVAVLFLVVVATVFLARQRHFDRIAAESNLVHAVEARDAVRSLLADRSGPTAELREAAERCRTAVNGLPPPNTLAWAEHPLVKPLRSEDRTRLAAVIGELHLSSARAEWLLAARQADSSVRQAHLENSLAASGAAWDCYSTESLPVALRAVRAAVLRELGRDSEAVGLLRGLTPTGDFADERAAARQALQGLKAGVKTESNRADYWLYLGRLELAVGDFGQARAYLELAAEIDPQSCWPYFHLGLACLEAKDITGAEAAFTHCIRLRHDVPEAYLNRAIARIELRHYAAAIADLDHIEPEAKALPRLYFVRETAKRRNGDAKGADRDRAAGIALEPTDAAGWNARGEAKLSLDPPDATGALSDFVAAVQFDPTFRQGYENQSNVLAEYLNRPAEAVEILDQAVERFPTYSLARSGRGVLLARLGKSAAARADAEAVLKLNPTPLVCYQAGCVYLLTATNAADRETAFGLLRRAIRNDPSWARLMPTDPDLKSLHDSHAFRELMRAATELLRGDR